MAHRIIRLKMQQGLMPPDIHDENIEENSAVSAAQAIASPEGVAHDERSTCPSCERKFNPTSFAKHIKV
jgi:hypothetical protein